MTHDKPRWAGLAGWAMFIFTLVLGAMGFASTFSTIQTRSTDHERRIEQLEQSAVTRREIDQMHQQLDRMEQEILQLDGDVQDRKR